MFGINFDPIHWLCVGLAVALLGLGAYTKVLSYQVEAADVALTKVEVLGEIQEEKAIQEDKESAESKEKVDETLRSTITKLQSDNERMRRKIASSRSLPATPQTCTGGGETTTYDWPLIEREIDNFRIRTRNLVEEGDLHREGLNSVKEWVADELADQ